MFKNIKENETSRTIWLTKGIQKIYLEKKVEENVYTKLGWRLIKAEINSTIPSSRISLGEICFNRKPDTVGSLCIIN